MVSQTGQGSSIKTVSKSCFSDFLVGGRSFSLKDHYKINENYVFDF